MSRPPRQASRSAVDAWLDAGSAACASALNFWGRVGEIDGRYGRSACERATSALLQSRSPRELLLGADVQCANFLVELGLTPALAAERFIRALNGWTDETPGGKGVRASSAVREVDGRSVLLPARVHEASQGFGVYSVPYASAQALVPEQYRPLYVGNGRAVAAVFIVDYRASDLGSYFEVGLSVYVTPSESALIMPGTFTHTLVVNDQFSHDAGRQIWGYPKTIGEIDIRYTNEAATCVLGPPGNAVVTIEFRRGGSGATTNIPVYTYTMLDAKPTLTLFNRSARSEGTGLGGDGVQCLPGSSEHALAETLRELEIPRHPLLWSWTDQMQGSFGVPHTL